MSPFVQALQPLRQALESTPPVEIEKSLTAIDRFIRGAGFAYPAHPPERDWEEIQASGIIPVLVNLLLRQYNLEHPTTRRFFGGALHAVALVMSTSDPKTTTAQTRTFLLSAWHRVFRRLASMVEDNRDTSEHALLDLFRIHRLIIWIQVRLSRNLGPDADTYVVTDVNKEVLVRLAITGVTVNVIDTWNTFSATDDFVEPFHLVFASDGNFPVGQRSVNLLRNASVDAFAFVCARILQGNIHLAKQTSFDNMVNIVHRHQTPGLRKAFTECGTYTAILLGYWSRRELGHGMALYEIDRHESFRYMILRSVIHTLISARAPELPNVFRQLLADGSWVMFLGLVVAGGALGASTKLGEDLVFWALYLKIFLKWSKDKQDKRPEFQTEWSHVMRGLRILERSSVDEDKHAQYTEAARLWREFGTEVEMSVEMEPSDGCSWFKCPLHGDKVGWEMMKCPCQQALYCSSSCQRMHWKGSHRHDCVARISSIQQENPTSRPCEA